jgi:DNA-binding response OmpR family regulator
MAKVLIVEDDAVIADAIAGHLSAAGFDPMRIDRGNLALARLRFERPDVCVLDLMLPGLDGFALCETLRERELWTPVLMLTARTEVTDRIRGLDGGADDYLVKPFDFDELRARLRVLIRRGPTRRPQRLEVGSLRLDPSTRIATRKGHQIELTAREFDVLAALARSPGVPVSRTTLLSQVWQGDPHVSPNIVDVYIGYLRKKLERPRGPRLIRTVRGKGFVLEAS